jgi:beta-N-acetylhexosaminidase
VDALLAGMTVEQKVGQLMVVSFSGTAMSAEAERMVREYHAGGVILFQQNLVRAEQTRRLTAQLQGAAKVPLLVAVDQEGGPVVRVLDGATAFPAQMAVGATFSTQAAAGVAAETAKELRALGLNVNFGPVADVNSNPRNPIIGTRAYGADPAMVGRLAAAAVQGAQGAGVLAVAKHFPGHGDADVDSHRALPLIEHPLTRLQTVELPPFRAAVEAGVDGIMTAHLLLPALEPDPKRSATLSPAVLGYLREQLGFKGLIVTDDLEMGAIVNDYGTAEAAKLAFQAGADVLLFRRDVAEQQRAHGLLVAAIKNGEIPQQRLDASVRRVLEAKARRGILNRAQAQGQGQGQGQGQEQGQATAQPAGSATGRPASGVPPTAAGGTPGAGSQASQSAGAAVALDVARRSLTLVKNEGGVLPLRLPEGGQGALCVVYPKLESAAFVEVMASSPSAAPGTAAGSGPQTLGDAVKAVYPAARLAPVGFRPTAEERATAEACARESRVVVLGSYNLHEYPQQAALLRGLLPASGSGKQAVVVALRLPYDLAQLEGAQGLLAAYSHRPASLQAVAEALVGRGPAPAGHLPVPVSERWPLGYGLMEWSRAETATAVR